MSFQTQVQWSNNKEDTIIGIGVQICDGEKTRPVQDNKSEIYVSRLAAVKRYEQVEDLGSKHLSYRPRILSLKFMIRSLKHQPLTTYQKVGA